LDVGVLEGFTSHGPSENLAGCVSNFVGDTSASPLGVSDSDDVVIGAEGTGRKIFARGDFSEGYSCKKVTRPWQWGHGKTVLTKEGWPSATETLIVGIEILSRKGDMDLPGEQRANTGTQKE
jgi:hypothetical protein